MMMGYSFEELIEQIESDRKIFNRLSDAVQEQHMLQIKTPFDSTKGIFMIYKGWKIYQSDKKYRAIEMRKTGYPRIEIADTFASIKRQIDLNMDVTILISKEV